MQELLSALVVFSVLFTIILIMFRVMLAPLRNLPIVGPIVDWFARLPGRFVRGASNQLKSWSKTLWRRMQRRGTSVLAQIILIILSAALAIMGFLIEIPAEILGAAAKSATK